MVETRLDFKSPASNRVINRLRQMKLLLTIVCFILLQLHSVAQSIVAEKNSANSFSLDNTTICVDADDYAVVKIAAGLLQKDID